MNYTKPDCLQWQLILLDFKNWQSFSLHFSSSHITQIHPQRPIIRLWTHLFYRLFKCLWYISIDLPFLTTPFPPSRSISPLMTFNHFLLQEFVNPWILHDYFILITSGFNICCLFWMVMIILFLLCQDLIYVVCSECLFWMVPFRTVEIYSCYTFFDLRGFCLMA